jgi:hypothetical protein
VGVGNRITLNGRWFLVSGIAVSAAVPPYPGTCLLGCIVSSGIPDTQPGLVWMTEPDAQSLATSSEPLAWFMNLRLANPADATDYAAAYNQSHPASSAPYLVSWQDIAAQAGRTISAPSPWPRPP